jgi:hypothetical protein
VPDIATISAVLNSLKIATDITKYFRKSDFSLEKAEMKLKVADLVGALAEAKLELVEIQDLIIEKDRIIAELRDAFESKSSLIRNDDAYYEADSEGNPSGVAFCLRCWESEHKKRQLVRVAKEPRMNGCTNCGQRYEDWRTQEIGPKQP